MPPSTAPVPGLATPFPSSQNPGQPATSSEAMELCEAAFVWGDEDVGFCMLPGGTSFFVWVESGEVFQVEAGDPFLDEFQRAVTARTTDLSAERTHGTRAGLEIIGLGLAYSWASVHCAAGGWAGRLRCAIAVAGFFVAGVILPNDAEGWSLSTLDAALQAARADYFLCRMRGGADGGCMEASGLSEELLEGTYGT